MAKTKNMYGLPRNIPTDIKRKVRQRDGFGCVFCAFPIIEYEHVDPTFAEAKEHRVEGITLLCPTCHAKVNKKQICKDLVKKAMKSPAALKEGQITDKILFIKSHPTVIVGGSTFIECDMPIMFRHNVIIAIRKENDRYFLNANLWDSKGQQTLKIVDNEWTVTNENIWDLTIVGNTITIYEKERSPALIFKIEDNNTFNIERIEMIIDGCEIIANPDFISVNGVKFRSINAKQCGIGIMLT